MQSTITWLEAQRTSGQQTLQRITAEKRKPHLEITLSPTELPLETSSMSALPKGENIEVRTLTEAIQKQGSAVEKWMSLPRMQDATDALIVSKAQEGYVLKVPARTQAHATIEIEAPPGSVFQRNLIIVQPEASLSLTIAYSSHADGFLGQTLDVVALQNSQIKIAEIQDFGQDHLSQFITRARVDRDARVLWRSVNLGAKKAIVKRELLLQGPGAEAQAVDVVFGDKNRELGFSTRLVHESSDTRSSLRMKSALRDKSRVHADGLARIEKNAPRSDSYVEEHALLLDKGARCDAIPSLEIENNDVKCAHSASVTQIDPEQLFYLRGRGLSLQQAREEIAQGFLKSALDSFDEPGLRASIEARIRAHWENR